MPDPRGRRGRVLFMRHPHPLSVSVRVKKLVKEATLPKQQTEESSGYDLYACITDSSGKFGLAPGERTLIGTGIAIAIDFGYEGQIRPRSGLANAHGITSPNSPGTIDSDYRGEMKVILLNTGNTPFIINHGDRIAQLVIQVIPRVNLLVLEEDDDFPKTRRGTGGFGSTGSA